MTKLTESRAQSALDYSRRSGHAPGMGLPNTPLTLTPEQLKELNQKLSHMRHEINNQLSLIVAALELIRFKPDLRDRMLDTLSQQPPKIMAEVAKFSAEFEQALGITRE
ncbi:MAG: hypothetical protein ABSH38_08145 [Verrucomicrobiota bacterium]|jgi:hypothetical protein